MDVTNDDTGSDFDVEAALLKSWNVDADEPSTLDEEDKKKAAEDDRAADDEDESVQEDQDSDDDESGEEDEGEQEDAVIGEDKFDLKVKTKVDGEEREFSIRELTRLAGQEAALTRKSQEVATTRKSLDEQATYTLAALDGMASRAKARWEPLSRIDFIALAKDPTVTAEEVHALQAQAKAAWDDVRFFESELGAFGQHMKQETQKTLMAQAKECRKVLSDPDGGIPNFDDKVYTELCDYGIKAGIARDVMLNLTDPASFKLVHKAMMFDRGKAQVKTDKTAKGKAPKKIVKGTASAQASKGAQKPTKIKAADARLRESGSVDDAAEALLARWASGDDE